MEFWWYPSFHCSSQWIEDTKRTQSEQGFFTNFFLNTEIYRPDKPGKNYDRLWKIRSLFDMLSDTYAKFYNQSEHLAVDEVIMLFKGRVIFKQYIPKKHKHFSIKIYKIKYNTIHYYYCCYYYAAVVLYRVYLNSTDKLLGLVGGFKVYSKKLVRVVCITSSLRYRPMNVPLRGTF
jgi:hypothetical protein